MNKIIINANGYSLKGRFYGFVDKINPRPALIFFCGWNPGSISWTFSDIYAVICSRKSNFICLTVALRGMGSKGDINVLTRSDFLDDVISAYDFLASHESVDKERISVIGESFGAYMACLLSAKRHLNNLILRVPTDFPNEGFSEMPQKKFVGALSMDWKSQKHQPNESFALEAVHNFENNIFIIASENDKIVPYQTTKNYLASISDSKKVEYILMKNAGHALINPLKQYEFIKILFGIINKYEVK